MPLKSLYMMLLPISILRPTDAMCCKVFVEKVEVGGWESPHAAEWTQSCEAREAATKNKPFE